MVDKKTLKFAICAFGASLVLTALLANAMTTIDSKPPKPTINTGTDSK